MRAWPPRHSPARPPKSGWPAKTGRGPSQQPSGPGSTAPRCTALNLGPGHAVPARDLVVPLVLLVSSCWACVREDLAEVVEAVDRGATSAEGEVGGGQQCPVLRVAAEVGGCAGQVVAEPPHAAAITMLVRDAVLERAEERVEGRRGALVGGRDQRAAVAGRPVAGVELDSWQVSLEGHAGVLDAVPGPGARAGEQDRLRMQGCIAVRPHGLVAQAVESDVGIGAAVDVDPQSLAAREAEVVIPVGR